MKSILENLKTTEFPRIRIGIGEPFDRMFLTEYVIGKISKDEYQMLTKGINTGAVAVEEILKKGIDNAMNIINVRN